jgi:hypothetical protein
MKKKSVSMVIFISLTLLLVLPIANTFADNPNLKILYVNYCDYDNDGKDDDVYAEVQLKLWKGTNYLVFEVTLLFDGEIIYSMYRDNHVITEKKIIYKIHFINVAYDSGWYDFQVWYEITNGDNFVYLYEDVLFDPPGGDPDVPPGGGFDPGP